MSYQTTPAEFLREIGWKYTLRGTWLTLKSCPFCGGGSSRDMFTFAVHKTDGNYFCHRAKCGEKGSFWRLIESQNRDPRNYWTKEQTKTKKRYLYS